MLALSYMQYLPRCARSSDTRLGVSQKKHRSRRLVEACVRGAFGVGRWLRVYPPERRPRTPACPRTLRAPEIAPLAGAAHPVARLDGGRGAAPKPQRRRRRQSRGQEPRGATSDITRVERGLRQPDQPPCGGACRHMRTVRGPAASGLRSLRPVPHPRVARQQCARCLQTRCDAGARDQGAVEERGSPQHSGRHRRIPKVTTHAARGPRARRAAVAIGTLLGSGRAGRARSE